MGTGEVGVGRGSDEKGVSEDRNGCEVTSALAGRRIGRGVVSIVPGIGDGGK